MRERRNGKMVKCIRGCFIIIIIIKQMSYVTELNLMRDIDFFKINTSKTIMNVQSDFIGIVRENKVNYLGKSGRVS